MFTEDKVTKKICIADVFCKVFDVYMVKYIVRGRFWWKDYSYFTLIGCMNGKIPF